MLRKLSSIVFLLLFVKVLFALSLLTVVLVVKSGLVQRYIGTAMSLYFAEVHHTYACLLLLWFAVYFLSTALTNVAMLSTTDMLLDNKNPRAQKAKLRGVSLRLHNAHNNLIEGLPGYLAALFAATMCKVSVEMRFVLSFIYLASRILYILMYAVNADVLRTFAWMVGQSACLLMFLFSLFGDMTGAVEKALSIFNLGHKLSLNFGAKTEL